MKIMKPYIIRLFPTPEQEELLYKNVNACRYIWNWALEYTRNHYEKGKQNLSRFSVGKLVTQLKKDKDHQWLRNTAARSLLEVVRDLFRSYESWWKGIAEAPKFKSKKSAKTSYPAGNSTAKYPIHGDTYSVYKVGRIKCQYSNLPVGAIRNPRIILEGRKWLVKVVVESENQALTLTDTPMGIDLGIKKLATVAFGDQKLVFHNINKSKKMRNLERKLSHLQKILSRKYRTNGNVRSQGFLKYKKLIQSVYRKMHNIRLDYIHRMTHALVALAPAKITIEDLHISNMVKNRHLAKAIRDASFYEIRRQLEYKCKWHEVPLQVADRFYGSSKTCSHCGNYNKDLKLSDRTYRCPSCGLEIDRDYNAALNLMRYRK